MSFEYSKKSNSPCKTIKHLIVNVIRVLITFKYTMTVLYQVSHAARALPRSAPVKRSFIYDVCIVLNESSKNYMGRL